MSSRPQEFMKFISKQNQKNGKDRVHSLSPNVRPPTTKNNHQNHQSNINNNKINIAPSNIYKNKNLIYNNNINTNQIQNYNIKVNRSKDIQKEKIIEGDLNFNFTNGIRINLKQSDNVMGNRTKGKNSRGLPRKSPVPINNNNIKNKNMFFNPLLNKPKTAFGNKNIMINNNKPLTSSDKNKKKVNRNQSPLFRTNENNNKIMALNKNVVKPRYISKSPVLGKNSLYNRYKNNYGFNKNSNSNNLIKSQNFKKGKIIHPQNKVNNVNSNFNNLNNITNNQLQQLKKFNKQNPQKKQTIITCEFEQDNQKNEPKVNLSKSNMIKNNNIVNQNSLNGSNILNANEINQSHNRNQNINPNIVNNYKQYQKPLQENNKIKNINNQKIQNIKLTKNLQPNEEEIKANQKESETIIEVDNSNNDKNKSQNKNENENKNENRNENKNENKNIINQKKEKEKEKEQSQEKPKPVYKKIKDLHIFTHVGFDGEQDKENNQDNYFIQKNFAGHKDYIYMSVCDGHGVNGHHVSSFIKTILPVDMSENLKHRNILTETEKTHEIIKETFIIANDKLVENQNIDSIFSGTTCVSVIYTPEKLICPNIGDSRAVLARYDNDKKKYIAIELTRDHKPTEIDERKRIIENDGRIQPFFEDGEFVGPERIWIKEEEVPGLAMTRSFGDRVAATVGVISEPEIKEFDLDVNDKFMIIASDGIWEFISSQECVDMVSSFYEKNDIKGCCQFLYDDSSQRWLKEEEVIDDTTIILVFFE
jgi:serine/threonine protein phosphatase PrpC